MALKYHPDGRTLRTYVRPNELALIHQTEERKNNKLTQTFRCKIFGPGGYTFIMMRSCVSFLYNKIQLKTYMHYELEIAKHLNRGTKSVEGIACILYTFVFIETVLHSFGAVVIEWQLDLQLTMQSVPIPITVVS